MRLNDLFEAANIVKSYEDGMKWITSGDRGYVLKDNANKHVLTMKVNAGKIASIDTPVPPAIPHGGFKYFDYKRDIEKKYSDKIRDLINTLKLDDQAGVMIGKSIAINGKYLTPEEFEAIDFVHVNSSLDLRHIDIKKLPKRLMVSGNLMLGKSVAELPENLRVSGDFWMVDSSVKELPGKLWIGGNFQAYHNKLTFLPLSLHVGGWILMMADDLEHIKNIPPKFQEKIITPEAAQRIKAGS